MLNIVYNYLKKNYYLDFKRAISTRLYKIQFKYRFNIAIIYIKNK